MAAGMPSGAAPGPSVETAGGAILDITDVSKSFPTPHGRLCALDGISLRVTAGRVTGLVGPDAAGKTTLMRLAAGLMEPDAGSIIIMGHDVRREPLTVQSALGYMPQRFGLYEDLSVQENMDLYADLQGAPKAARPARYEELMRMTGLGDFTRRLAGRLSGGMKQKLGLACTLIRSPRMLLLDEPTVGVDPVSRRELWQIVYRLVREEGTTVLLSTAYLDEAERCDDVAMLHEGKMLGQGPPSMFTERVKGRTFSLSSESLDRRELLSQVMYCPGIMDAVLQGDRLRIVLEEGTKPDPKALCADLRDLRMEPVPPRFEDSFVASLRGRQVGERHPAVALKGEIWPRLKGAEENIIEVRDLQRRFGDFYAVKGVTFSVRRGEVFGLLGANGAGKTTTFRMLCGLLPLTAGEVRVAGADLRHAAAVARGRIGYMSQKFSLYGNLSVRDNLEFFSSAYGLSGKRRREKIEWVLDEFGLTSHATGPSGELPLGFKQRLAMGCALMHEPEALFLDEPTSGVDPLARREFWARINALADAGVTVMVTTHFMQEAEYCDRLAIMAMGEILDIGTPEEIRRKARTAEQPDPTMEDAFIHLAQSPKERP
jgi:ABC-2 type transport system ATP-binding protein